MFQSQDSFQLYQGNFSLLSPIPVHFWRVCPPPQPEDVFPLLFGAVGRRHAFWIRLGYFYGFIPLSSNLSARDFLPMGTIVGLRLQELIPNQFFLRLPSLAGCPPNGPFFFLREITFFFPEITFGERDLSLEVVSWGSRSLFPTFR